MIWNWICFIAMLYLIIRVFRFNLLNCYSNLIISSNKLDISHTNFTDISLDGKQNFPFYSASNIVSWRSNKTSNQHFSYLFIYNSSYLNMNPSKRKSPARESFMNFFRLHIFFISNAFFNSALVLLNFFVTWASYVA